jgi:hypothetical protein
MTPIRKVSQCPLNMPICTFQLKENINLSLSYSQERTSILKAVIANTFSFKVCLLKSPEMGAKTITLDGTLRQDYVTIF